MVSKFLASKGQPFLTAIANFAPLGIPSCYDDCQGLISMWLSFVWPSSGEVLTTCYSWFSHKLLVRKV
ncbi:MAG: hypothetical protein ABIK83_00240, partial [Candidatus Zixiibacteriota bacterium]